MGSRNAMEKKTRHYHIDPVPKPRMTRRDQWKRRPIVQRYFAFRDQVKICGIKLPLHGAHIVFVIPVPKSWSKKKQSEQIGKPHMQRPDIDNYLKGLLDAVFIDDSLVWDCRATKIWGELGRIIVKA
jgi:Holliday junction resolvase RusA-like endonuclease